MGYVMYMVYANKPATIDEHRTNIEHEITAVSASKSSKIVFSVVAMQKKSRFIHNVIERTCTVLISKIVFVFVALLLKNPLYGRYQTLWTDICKIQ